MAGDRAIRCRRPQASRDSPPPTWAPTGPVFEIFQVMRPYMPPLPSPAPPSPFEWGKRERIQEFLGENFDLKFEPGVSTLRMPSSERVWQVFNQGYGPTKSLHQAIDRKDDLKRDFMALHDRYSTELGVAMPREYLVTIGKRR